VETISNLAAQYRKITNRFPDMAPKLAPMKPLHRFFTDHPATVGENYLEHLGSALSFAGPLFLAAVCGVVHAVLPFLFPRTGSRIVMRLNERMVTNRARAPVARH
jgi:hypothetical protein